VNVKNKEQTTDGCGGILCPEELAHFRKAFEAEPRNRTALNAVTKNPVKNVAMNRAAVVRNNHTDSHTVKTGASTSQNSSGRCWMFAGLNLFRMKAASSMNMEDFEISQNYTMFWDKLEKSNYFLESILKTLDMPTGDRLIAWLMGSPIQDGGQWDMFVNLVRKYGVVPKEVMPETESSSATGQMNDRITWKLREYAAGLRAEAAAGATRAELEGRKQTMLEEVYRMLSIHLGEPPTEFLWQWRDKEKEFHRDGIVTPKQFMEKHVSPDFEALVCLIHCPQAAKSYNTLYTIDYLGNVVGGEIIRYLNVHLDVLKQAAVEMIRDGKPVWFGCDVGKLFDRDLGMMDVELFDYEGVYGLGFGMDKAERLDYGQSLMTHAMVLTGVDLDDDGKPRKWRVENSWGDKGGDKGFMLMTDAWFDQFLYEVVVDRRYVSAEILALLEGQPTVLPPWDPMGSLASAE
jgi:bleomycin hydrolase